MLVQIGNGIRGNKKGKYAFRFFFFRFFQLLPLMTFTNYWFSHHLDIFVNFRLLIVGNFGYWNNHLGWVKEVRPVFLIAFSII